jgi:hypothetical protein
MKLEFSRQTFEKCSNTKFSENPFSGSRFVACGRTDRQTDTTKLIVASRTFAKAPGNYVLIVSGGHFANLNVTEVSHSFADLPRK